MEENPVILALYPNAIGIGFACLQIPDHLFEFGITTAKPISNRTLLKKAEKFMDYYKPHIVILKEIRTAKMRNHKLIDAIETLSGEKSLKVFKYTKEQIKDVFEVFGATTQYEIVQKLVTMFPDLAHRTPKPKKWYEKEDYNMGIFNAVSLAITHRYLTE
jgi:hypothetical protein